MGDEIVELEATEEFETESDEHVFSPCGQCGASLVFSPNQSSLYCDYCGHTEEIATVDQLNQVIHEHDLEQALQDPELKRGLGTKMRVVVCSSCGARVQVSPEIVSDECDFCGEPRVMVQEEDDDRISPESLVPFQFDGKKAKQLFSDWLGTLWFRPNDLKKRANVREMAGVYVPYWTFDAGANSRWTADAGHYYWVQESYTAFVNGKHVRKSKRVRKIRWVPADGQRSDSYDDILVCASEGLPQDLVGSLDSFDTSTLVPYEASYLSGWKAEAYAVELLDGWKDAHSRLCDSQYSRCGGDVPGDTHRNLRVSTKFFDKRFKHILLPIFIAAYRYNDQIYRVLINGQTGEVEGTAPMSWAKIVGLIAGLLIGAGIVAGLISLSQ